MSGQELERYVAKAYTELLLQRSPNGGRRIPRAIEVAELAGVSVEEAKDCCQRLELGLRSGRARWANYRICSVQEARERAARMFGTVASLANQPIDPGFII